MSFYVIEEGSGKEIAGPFTTRGEAHTEASRLSSYTVGFTVGLEESLGAAAMYARPSANYRVIEK